ncbi:MAG: outer membrane protein assembly factor BamD [Hyphomicrobiaceae bacterium]|nr:outer membrane protein assembly factor BamD [Hyphomicrobiaceae bacterium]
MATSETTDALDARRWPSRRVISARAPRLLGCVLALAGISLLQGCSSSTGDLQAALNPDPPGQMFAAADKLMGRGKYESAAKKFEDLDRDHPYAPEARRAIVMAAYAYYKAGKLPEAIASAERYTTMHPGTKEAALAHHIIASSYFDEMGTPNRDQSSTKKALRELKKLKAQYPDSEYAQKADNRIRLAEDTLAASEMEVGRYYLKNGNHVAAINRFKSVVSEYQTTAHVEEALMRLVESYMALGIKPEAQSAAAVLGHNFPNSRWYKDAYALLQTDGLAPRENSESWISKAWKAVPKLSLGGPT